jgi:hypothetical protein
MMTSIATKFQYTCISNIDNTSHEEETSNNRRKTKSLHSPQLDHHDTDGLAGHKTWRTTPDHHEEIQMLTPLDILTFYIWKPFLRRILMILQFLFSI